jgi:hypothetical protein
VAQKPANEKLWAILTSQARAKYSTYPSPGASAWVHKQYVMRGGRFIDSTMESKRKKMLSRQFEEKKKKKHLDSKKNKDGHNAKHSKDED